MAKIVIPLSDTKIRSIKPLDKIIKLSDGKGLYFVVLPKGTRFFRFDYTYAKKRNSISFGTYPEVSLAEARQKLNEARKLIANGYDPSAVKQNQISQELNTFEKIAREWIEKVGKKGWRSKKTYISNISSFENYIFPIIGNIPIHKITRADIISSMAMMDKKGLKETTRKVFNIINRIFKYATSYAIIEHNIISDIDTKHVFTISSKATTKHFPAITDERYIPALLRDIDSFGEMFKADISTMYLLKIMPYLFLRPSEIRNATWDEVDLKNRILEIPAHRMKNNLPHIVPLSKQAYDLLLEIKPYSSYKSKYIFPSPRTSSRPLSENTINNALKNMGYKDIMVGHGFRAMASSILHEKIQLHGFSSDIIEYQLSHREQNKVKSAYNREYKFKYIEERIYLMQWYADYLDNLRNS